MTATVSRVSPRRDEEGTKRNKRVVAFGLAGVVAAAGIAGAVITSTAYFTDTETIASNSVRTKSIKIDVTNTGTATILTPIDQIDLKPVATENLDAQAMSTTFDIKNVGEGPFTWTMDIENLELTRVNGDPLPAGSDATHLSAADSMERIKYQFATQSAGALVWGTTYSLSDVSANSPEFASPAAYQMQAEETTVHGVRFWIEPSADDNKLQDVKFTFDLKTVATQIH